MTMILRGRKIVGGRAEGKALVTKQGISFNGGTDPMTGVVTERGHELEGESYKGKIFVFPYGKGASGAAGDLHVATMLGNAPKAIINNKLDTQIVLGAMISGIPMVAELDKNPLEVIETGDSVEVNADEGLVKVYKSNNNKITKKTSSSS